MKPYLLFCGDTYYPLGGWEDFKGSFDTLEDARAAMPIHEYSWAHIAFDGAIVEGYSGGKLK